MCTNQVRTDSSLFVIASNPSNEGRPVREVGVEGDLVDYRGWLRLYDGLLVWECQLFEAVHVSHGVFNSSHDEREREEEEEEEILLLPCTRWREWTEEYDKYPEEHGEKSVFD